MKCPVIEVHPQKLWAICYYGVFPVASLPTPFNPTYPKDKSLYFLKLTKNIYTFNNRLYKKTTTQNRFFRIFFY